MKNNLSNSQNTRHNAFKNLKAYLNIAKAKRLINHNPLERPFPARQVQTDREYLTENELQSLMGLYHRNFLKTNDQRVLRHFLFMCVTGLRISDLKTLEMSDIVNDILIFTAYKTRTQKPASLKIPLCPFAKRLIKDESPLRLYGKIFNCLSEQKMREKIKEIVKVEKIYKDISLHTGRHTFATIFLRKTKNIAALQKLLGHSSITQTMIYAHVLTEDIEREMRRAFNEY